MVEYYKNPDATSKAVVKGWIRTGDIGYFNQEFKIKVEDRKIDVIDIGDKKYVS